MGGVGWVQWKHDTSSLERIGTAREKVVDGAWHVGEGLDSVEGRFIEDASLIVVDNKDTSTWQDIHKGVQIVRVGTIKPVQVLRISSRWGRKDLARRCRSGVGTNFTTEDKNRAVGHDHSGRIPTTSQERNFILVLLPIAGSGNTWRSAWGVQADTVSGSTSPSSNVELSTCLVRKSNTGGAEDVTLHVKRSPGFSPIGTINQRKIELVSTSCIGGTSSGLLHEYNLIVDTSGGEQRNNNAGHEECIRTGSSASWLMPDVDWVSDPLVVGISASTSTIVVVVTRARYLTIRLGEVRDYSNHI